MRFFFLLALLALLVGAVSAWEKEDHEIFDLVSELEASEGKGTSFYSWLEVPSTATTAQISKAYRRKSMLLHPDKNPGVKGIHERFARLGVIATILRDARGRERYDHFYKNGVPRWRGTGYYYSRWRPGMVEVLVFLTLLTSLLQYTVQRMTYQTDLRRIETIISNAKLAAWGPKMIPVDGKRKVKVSIGGTPRIDDEGNQIGGRMIDMVVEGNGFVSIVDDTGDLHPLDTDSAIPAAISRTWPPVLTRYLVSKIIHRAPKDSELLKVDDADKSESGSESPGSRAGTPNNETAPAILKGGRAATVKAGGKRRKAVRSR